MSIGRTDSDRLNVANGSKLVSAEEGLPSRWGEPPPDKFISHVSPYNKGPGD